jgi:hypothetical protein
MIDAPLPQVVEELAHAVVADRRAGRAAPPALMVYIDLFAPDLRESSPDHGVHGSSSSDDGTCTGDDE